MSRPRRGRRGIRPQPLPPDRVMSYVDVLNAATTHLDLSALPTDPVAVIDPKTGRPLPHFASARLAGSLAMIARKFAERLTIEAREAVCEEITAVLDEVTFAELVSREFGVDLDEQ